MSKESDSLQQVPSDDLEELNSSSSSSSSKGLNPRPILRTVQRQAWLVMALALSASTAALLSAKKEPSSYEGSFRLLVEPVTSEAKFTSPTALTRSEGRLPDDKVFNLDYPTQLEILQSPGMLSVIVEQIKTQYPKFSLSKLQKGLTVKRTGGENLTDRTKILEIRYQGLNPQEVEFVLQKTAEKYLKYSLEERKSSISGGIKFIEEQLPELQNRVNILQAQLQKLQERYSLVDPKSEGEELGNQVRQINNQQIETQRQLKELRILYVNLQKQLELTPNQAIAASALTQDPNRSALLGKLKEVESQIAIESARFTPNNPIVQALQDKRQRLLALLDGETQRILGQNSVEKVSNSQVQTFQNDLRMGLIKQLVETTNQIEVLETRNQALTQTKNAFERQALQFPAIARQYNDIERKLEITNQTLNQLLTQRETLRIEAEQKNVPWELISKPDVERDADGNPVALTQKSSKKVMMGMVGGLLLGVGAAILLEKLRNIFYTVEDIGDAIELPLLGMIPLNNNQTQKIPKSMAFVKWIVPREETTQNSSAFVEAFESLYTRIRFLYTAPPLRSVVICSATDGDGKSTIALNLAQMAAAMGQRVLLVDANLRHPQLHVWLKLPNHKGLCEILRHKLSPNTLISRSLLSENLYVLTAGQPTADSPKQLASNQMQRLMEELQASFDLVIYDTPSLLTFTDASFLAPYTDGILMVIGVATTKKSAVMKTMEQIKTFGLPTVGVVANYTKAKSLPARGGNRPPTDTIEDELELETSDRAHPQMNSKSL